MKLEGKRLGFIITSALNSINCSIDEMKKLSKINNISIYPIMSYSAYKNVSQDILFKIENISKNKIVHNFEKIKLDIGLIEPCTGNTMSKLANNIIDTPALYVANNLLILQKPLVIGISSFSGISSSFINIGRLIDKKNIFFIPFRQTNPITRPNYLMCDPKLTIKTLNLSIEGYQIEPILL